MQEATKHSFEKGNGGKEACKVHHFGGYLKNFFKKRAIKLVTHVEPHASAVSLLKRAENSAI